MLNSDTESPAPFVLNTANLHIICKKKKKIGFLNQQESNLDTKDYMPATVQS